MYNNYTNQREELAHFVLVSLQSGLFGQEALRKLYFVDLAPCNKRHGSRSRGLSTPRLVAREEGEDAQNRSSTIF